MTNESNLDPDVSILGIIPARGGSKGVHKKNIKPLGKKPLIAYTIEAALASKLPRVIVSTDSEEIAKVAEEYGVDAPFLRTESLAADTSSSFCVIKHALDFLEMHENYTPYAVLLLQQTSPFRTAYHINSAIEKLSQFQVNSVVGVKIVNEHPFLMFEKNDNELLTEIMSVQYKPMRRQEFPEYYFVNGSVYLTKTSTFKDLPGPTVCDYSSAVGLVMDEVSSVDINSEFDFMIAEKLLEGTQLNVVSASTTKFFPKIEERHFFDVGKNPRRDNTAS